LCTQTCIRTHLDEPLAIRDIKRFIMDREQDPAVGQRARPSGKKVAIIGAGPGGIAAASELAHGGFEVDIFEQHPYAGGMVGGVVPEYRLPQSVFDRDFRMLKELGVRIHYDKKAGRDFGLSQLRREGFDHIVIMVGAQLSKTLRLEGEDCDGVMEALQFLRRSREGKPIELGEHVGIIGAGDTAMDCARVAWRRSDSRVTLIYRRTIDQMPADREEIEHLVEEGIEVLELAKPQRLAVQDGRLCALVCRRMVFAGDRDASGRKIPHEVADSDFEVPLDTLIMAISQHAVLDFFDNEQIALNDRGYIEVDPVTFETSVPGVYAGGDVVNEGPASIVKAAAAGKAIANSILNRHSPAVEAVENASVDPVPLLRRRAHREWRVPAPLTPLEDRHNFKEVVLTYSEQQARTEAARCLNCDTYCSLCVGVCPNLALQTCEMEPFEVRLPKLSLSGNEIQIDAGAIYKVEQPYQIAVLTDFCNECGNCTTFCPTSGQPYRDKPRLYLDRLDFEAQADNAFMVWKDNDRWVMDARWQGATHRIELDGKLEYTGPSLRARVNPATFEVEQAEPNGSGNAADPLSLERCAAMYVLLRGLRQSMPFLPTAWPDNETAAGKIAHPGYAE
jgi:putative selenate reductase